MSSEKLNKINYALLLVGCLMLLMGGGINLYTNNLTQLNRASHVLEDWMTDRFSVMEAIVDEIDAKDSAQLFSQINTSELPKHSTLLIYSPDRRLLFWSDNISLPQNSETIFRDKIRLLKVGNTYSAIRSIPIKNGYTALMILGIYNAFPVANKYLQNGFVPSSPFLKKLSISAKQDELSNEAKDVFYQGTAVFSIQEDPAKSRPAHPFVILLELVALIMIFVSINRLVRISLMLQQPHTAVIYGVGLILLVETLISFLHFPAFSSNNALFSSSTFASPLLGDSLGVFVTVKSRITPLGRSTWFEVFFQVYSTDYQMEGVYIVCYD